jgi:hypothetical protein
MTHEIEFKEVSQRLPSTVRLGFDGLRIVV